MTATSMRPNLKPNPAWASLPLFDRAGWKRMAFGEFVESIGERAEPKDAQEEIYLGLEHLDPQCLHIRRWGKGSDVIGGKLRFRKGDIIFGKRRAYQRKLAVAEFGGICSAHAMVIRARPDKVLPEFLPFLMMSDRFMNRAVEISVGSLSPTINWTTLKLETFDLPPLDQQRRIAEILWAVDKVKRCWQAAVLDYAVVHRTVSDSMLECGTIEPLANKRRLISRANMRTFTLGKLGATFGGLTGKSGADFGAGKPYIPYLNIYKNNRINTEHLNYVNIGLGENQNEVKQGDIFFTGSSETADEVGVSSVLLDDIGTAYLNSFCIGYRLFDNSELLPEYARFLFRGRHFRQSLVKLAQGATRFNLSKRYLMQVEISIPCLDAQMQIAEYLSKIENQILKLETHLNTVQNHYSALINSLIH